MREMSRWADTQNTAAAYSDREQSENTECHATDVTTDTLKTLSGCLFLKYSLGLFIRGEMRLAIDIFYVSRQGVKGGMKMVIVLWIF